MLLLFYCFSAYFDGMAFSVLSVTEVLYLQVIQLARMLRGICDLVKLINKINQLGSVYVWGNIITLLEKKKIVVT